MVCNLNLLQECHEACDNITKVIQCVMEADIPHTYKLSRPNRKPLFTKDCNLARKCKIETHKHFLRNRISLTSEANIEARNRYNKTDNEAKQIRFCCIPMVVGHFGNSPSTWTTSSQIGLMIILQLIF